MNLISITFPSVIEGHNSSLFNVANNQLNGLKLRLDNNDYMLGNLALTEGENPHKAINSSPEDKDYRLLINAGLLLASRYAQSPFNVATGFPFSSYMINKKVASELISSVDNVQHDTRTYGGADLQSKTVMVNRVDVIPELIAGTLGVRKTMDKSGNFFVISLGYGTTEIGLSTDDGITQRTRGSSNGLRVAINWLKDQLMEQHYLGMRTEHQMDTVFQRGHMTVNRKRINVTELRTDALRHYYQEVVSPLIRYTWQDEDFDRTDTIMLVGGGAMYPELVELFKNEFGGFLNIEVADDPITMASRGYCLRAASLTPNSFNSSVGIDVGNAQTTITVFENDKELRKEEAKKEEAKNEATSPE